ncbi:NADPH-dependent F420 reductase [Paracoccus sp. DMF]|uniref:NADPH-dependent F420 reductase n=1 Tax=Paracoccus sp. DMF TaxID=400837 RepID=UPI001105004B|nr:NAD(P)-binding domain-containing protein [Paracoccus sp. DMF]MCV2449158.1 NAD(P)-binding domain-containing protein [Paracoccus sp. DMF]
MKIGIIGAGRMAQAVGLLAARAGHQVMLSNSRGPETIRHIGQQIGCEVGTVDDVAAFGEMIVAAIHLQMSPAIPAAPLAGKIVLNPQNYFPHFGPVPALDSGELTTAEVLARLLPGSKVVKALNSILVEDVVPDARPAGAKDRRALPMAGDDADAKAAVTTFLDQIGYDSVDAGGLADGWRFERRRPVYCISLDRNMLEERLATTTRDSFVPDGNWRFDRGIRT